MKHVATFMRLGQVVDTESLGMLANLAQHVLAADKPSDELKRLLKIIDPELKPVFRISKKD